MPPFRCDLSMPYVQVECVIPTSNSTLHQNLALVNILNETFRLLPKLTPDFSGYYQQ